MRQNYSNQIPFEEHMHEQKFDLYDHTIKILNINLLDI